ncbi:MAG: ATP-binding cassette domain-containing protein [Anaerolineales bacterium]|nr:MAG: ATP-binding cassette domain-containing protein [Anaerolineales bacterium]
MNTLDTRRIWIFVGLAFGICWAIAGVIYLNGGLVNSPEILPGTGITLATALLALGCMWAPAVAHLLTRVITREGWKDMWLRPQAGRNWMSWALAWVLPPILTLLGLVVYFAIYPSHFDSNLSPLQTVLDNAAAMAGQELPFDVWTVMLIQIGQGVLLGPIINGIFTFGEEFGWRAYLQPKLMPLGFRKAMLAVGVIWGLWHAPIIAMGHNYGFGYWGEPWTGILAMVWFTIPLAVIIGWLTLRGGSVWPAVIAHGSINAIAGVGIYMTHLDAPGLNSLLGPLPTGLIGGLPSALLAAYLLWKNGEEGGTANDVSRETSGPSAGPATPPSADAIIASGLTKRFGSLDAVDHIDLKIPVGEVFGLLGPNGAGKTTTIRMLAALISPTEGEAWVAGHRVGDDNTQLRKDIGILTETPGMYEQLSAERNLDFFARMYEVEDIPGQVERYLRMLGLWGRRHEAVGGFSKGMRQKLAIARALLHEPKVIFLDEPTSGLDPEASRVVRDFIEQLRGEGRTIIVTTHNLDEADRLCDRIAVFKSKLLAVDTPNSLRRKLFGRSVVFHLAAAKEAFVNALRQKSYVHEADLRGDKIVVKLDDPEAHNPELLRELVGLGADVQFVGEIRQSLEDVYFQLLGAQAQPEAAI